MKSAGCCEHKGCKGSGVLRFDTIVLCENHFKETIKELRESYKKRKKTAGQCNFKGNGIECPICKSTNTVKNAIAPTGKQRYLCNYCCSRFVVSSSIL